MTTTIFDKTAKGRNEIATRAHHLAPRLRTLLLLVDGKRDTVELMVKVAGLGLNEKSLVELLDGAFIQVAGSAAPAEVAPTAPSPAPATFAALTAPSTSSAPALSLTTTAASPVPALADASVANAPTSPVAGPPAPAEADLSIEAAVITPPRPLAVGRGILRDGETQFQALYNFFNETIRSAIGLRGFTMQLKVERAATIADFRLLRPAYLEAVLKAKGPEMEHSLRNRLDQLLGLGD